MSSKESKGEVAVDKVTENNDKATADGKSDLKGTKRPAEVSSQFGIITLVHGIHWNM